MSIRHALIAGAAFFAITTAASAQNTVTTVQIGLVNGSSTTQTGLTNNSTTPRYSARFVYEGSARTGRILQGVSLILLTKALNLVTYFSNDSLFSRLHSLRCSIFTGASIDWKHEVNCSTKSSQYWIGLGGLIQNHLIACPVKVEGNCWAFKLSLFNVLPA